MDGGRGENDDETDGTFSVTIYRSIYHLLPSFSSSVPHCAHTIRELSETSSFLDCAERRRRRLYKTFHLVTR